MRPRQPYRSQHLEGNEQVAPLQPPLQPRDREPDDAVAQRRDLLHLHLALGADEEQFDLVAQPPFQRLGDRHGRVDMTARTAARKNDFFHIIIVSQDSIFSFRPVSAGDS